MVDGAGVLCGAFPPILGCSVPVLSAAKVGDVYARHIQSCFSVPEKRKPSVWVSVRRHFSPTSQATFCPISNAADEAVPEGLGHTAGFLSSETCLFLVDNAGGRAGFTAHVSPLF